jgi:GDPmannose 4,6-dehydratase
MKSLIFGVSGQIGSYLAELLVEAGHEVVGVTRAIGPHNWRVAHINNRFFSLLEGDVSDPFFVQREISKGYDEVYGLAAQSSVGLSFQQPHQTFTSGVMGIVNILESIRIHSPKTKFFNASSSEMYGEGVIKENSPMRPHSPYGISKAAAHNLVSLYREQYGLKCCSGILFNTESKRRGPQFVTKKIIDYVRTKDFTKKLKLGNINIVRDWTHASDVAEAIYLMMDKANKDYVISRGRPDSIRSFIREAFCAAGIYNIWENIEIDESLFRNGEVKANSGDSSLIREELGWTPSYKMPDIIQDMLNG